MLAERCEPGSEVAVDEVELIGGPRPERSPAGALCDQRQRALVGRLQAPGVLAFDGVRFEKRTMGGEYVAELELVRSRPHEPLDRADVRGNVASGLGHAGTCQRSRELCLLRVDALDLG